MDIFIDLINFIFDGIAETIDSLLSVFPQSPVVNWANNKPTSLVLGHITWFIPFPTMIIHFVGMLTAIGIYYLYRVVGRWLKVVRG